MLPKIFSSKKACWTIVIFSLALTVLLGTFALTVEHDDDLLAFLPEGNADVAAFYEINQKFGSLDVAIVGIGVEDPFEPAFFARLKKATQALNEEKAVHFALSLANVEDFKAAEEGGIVTDLLVPQIPSAPADRQQLVDYVMSKDLVVGNLVSADRHGVIIYCFSTFGSDPKAFAHRIRTIATESFPTETLYWGGAPFINTYIYEATQEDLSRLTPWAVLVIILLIVLSFRDPIGAVLALVSTGMGIAMTVGVMGILGVDYNLVLSSMPVILFSVGSAYPIHVLARFYQVGDIHRTLTSVGPIVLAAGLTTVAGLLSFLAMDIAPMRTFGLFTALGIGFTLVLSLSFVPAVVSLFGLSTKRFGRSAITAAILPVVEVARRRPKPVGLLLLVVGLVGGWYALTVDNRMDQTAFFARGSPPDQADRFLLEHFGGATFIQVSFTADLTSPEVLREIGRVADRIQMIDAVSHVQHAGQVITQVNQAMEGALRIPDEAAKVKVLYRLLAGNAALNQLVTQDQQQGLLVVKVRSTDITEIEETLAAVESIVNNDLPRAYRIAPTTEAEAAAKNRLYALGRIRRILQQQGRTLTRPEEDLLRVELEKPLTPVLPQMVQPDLDRFLGSEECLVDLETSERTGRLAAALVTLGPRPTDAQLTQVISDTLEGDTIEGEPVDDLMVSDLVAAVRTPIREIWRRHNARAHAKRILRKVAPQASPESIADVLLIADAPTALVPAAQQPPTGTIDAAVNGLPVLHRGLSASATRNQLLSLALAMMLVLVLLSITFRSLKLGLLASTPTLLTLLVIYGGMGWLGVHLDIGTSMLASIIIGAGVDYAVHFVAAWRTESSATAAVEKTGPAIWTNALMVAAGFFVLTLGEARPLQNVGGLTSAAMLAAALSTFLAIPVLAGRAQSGLKPAPVPVPDDSPKGATP